MHGSRLLPCTKNLQNKKRGGGGSACVPSPALPHAVLLRGAAGGHQGILKADLAGIIRVQPWRGRAGGMKHQREQQESRETVHACLTSPVSPHLSPRRKTLLRCSCWAAQPLFKHHKRTCNLSKRGELITPETGWSCWNQVYFRHCGDKFTIYLISWWLAS